MSPPVELQFGEEKRNAPRFPWIAELAAVVSSEYVATEQPQSVLQGVTVNIGKGGIAIIGDRLLPPGAVVRCQIRIQDSAWIPTLLKVCWANEGDAKGQYKMGLQFLL